MDDEALALVGRFLPGSPARTVSRLGAGLDNVAYLVDGELVVRRNTVPSAVEREAQLLRAVAGIAPVPVPEPLFVDTTGGWICYRKLAGVPLLDLPAQRRSALAPAVGAVLGELLSALHTADLPPGLAEVDDTPPREWLADIDPRVAGALGTTLNRAVEAFLAGEPPEAATVLAFSHHDLGAEHVLVDPATGVVTGVIDWTDAAVADPAYDFGLVLRDLGRDGLAPALAAYRRPVDDRRIVFYAVCKALEDLEYGLRVHKYRDNALDALHRLL